jgi:hypothetical protein
LPLAATDITLGQHERFHLPAFPPAHHHSEAICLPPHHHRRVARSVGCKCPIFPPPGWGTDFFPDPQRYPARNSRWLLIAPLMDSAGVIATVIATRSRVARCGALYPRALPYLCHSKTCHLLAEMSTWAGQEICIAPLLDYPKIRATSWARTLKNPRHYHSCRTHLSLSKDSPDPRALESVGDGNIVAQPRVGGLHHRYTRIAA